MKFLIVLLMAVTTWGLVSIPRQKMTAVNQEKIINFHPRFLSILSLGHDRFLSAIYWIMAMIQSDIDRSQKEGELSWMYYRFLQIAHLDPFFYENYSEGGLYLSVIKDDVLGAKILFEKGLQFYRNDFQLNYYGAFNDFFELDDKNSALKKYRRLLTLPESIKFPYLYTLTAKIQSKSSGIKEAEKTLEMILRTVRHKRVREKILEALYSIKARRDLACLNRTKKETCSLRDYEGNIYIRDEKGLYKAQRPTKAFEVKRKKSEK